MEPAPGILGDDKTLRHKTLLLIAAIFSWVYVQMNKILLERHGTLIALLLLLLFSRHKK